MDVGQNRMEFLCSATALQGLNDSAPSTSQHDESPATSLSKISLVAQQDLTGQIGATLVLSKKHCLMVRRQLMEPTLQHESMKISYLGRRLNSQMMP